MWMSHISQLMVGIGLLASTNIHGVLGANGGSYCADVMCVGATISGGNTFYTLNTTVPFSKLGWMAIGFGTEMAGSPMMILWPNSDGSVTLSQRSASGENEPKVVSNPPRKATLQTGLSTLTGSAVTLSFSVPNSGQSSEEIIYGLSLHRPSSDVGASLQVHNFKGDFKLDLTQTVADLPSSVTTGTGSSSNTLPLPTGNEGNQAYWPPLSSWEKMMVTHGVVSALGFCLFLPIGVLQARFLRIWWPKWFRAHWIIQFVLAGLTIVAGVGLGVAAVHQSGGSHFSDKHMIIGLVLFLLYIGQALYGYVIHKVKKANRTRRPIQNYGHAIVGLGLIALALYQVWLGFDDEWSDITGRDKPSHGLYTFWTVWIAVLGGAYILGLALLPKQYSGEAQAVRDREKSQGMSGSYDDMYPLAERAS